MNHDKNIPDLPDSPNTGGDDHNERVRSSFNEWRESVRHRIKPQDEEHINNIEDAVLVRDSERARKHLEESRTTSSWLEEELMKHPTISTVMRELAIFGL
jgi:hypothetical protein